MFEARDLDSCRCGARWADDDLARCPGCGRDLDIEIAISYDEECETGLGVWLRPGERAVWRTSTETWGIVSLDGEESLCTAWACEWFDRLNTYMREEAGGC